MKPLLPLLLTPFVCLNASAQNTEPQSFQYNPKTSFIIPQNKPWAKPLNDSNIVLKSLAALKGKKPGVYRLPQDGMPCIVPDTKDIAALPNAWKGTLKTPYKSRPPRIPNPVKPQAAPDDTK